MGGALILAAIIIPTLLWADLTNVYIWLTLFIIGGYGVIGFVDDYKKVVEKNPKGLSPRQKMFWQVLMAAAVGIFLSICRASPLNSIFRSSRGCTLILGYCSFRSLPWLLSVPAMRLT